MLNIEFELDGKIVSVNKTYLRGRFGGIYLNPEVVSYRKEVAKKLKRTAATVKKTYEGGELHLHVVVYATFYNKNGTVKRLDIDNFAKGIIDSIFPVFDIDDKMIFRLEMKKHAISKGEPKVKVKLKEYSRKDKKGVKNDKKK